MITETSSEVIEEIDKTEIYRQAKRIIEGLLFSTNEPLTLRRLCNALQKLHPLETKEVKELVDALANDYIEQDRAFRVVEIAKGYMLRTSHDLGSYIHDLLKTSRPDKLSHAAAEVLAIIAYRQPITRPQIDEIRGVDSSGIVATLIERQLVEPLGKLEVPGRPSLYGVSTHFLKYFGLKDLKELPQVPQLAKKKEEVKEEPIVSVESEE